MKKITPLFLVFILQLFANNAKAQVWFPEGEYAIPVTPIAISIDNSIIFTVGKYTEDTAKSYWIVSKYDGKNWSNLPALILNKTAEVMTIKFYGGSIYVGGNFTFDNGLYSSLIRFNGTAWVPVTKFKRANSQLPITVSSLEVFNKKLILGGNFNSVITTLKDSLPYLIAYNGTDFSSVFNNCKNCYPNGPVIDLAVNDTLLAVAGAFNTIKGRRSSNLFLHYANEKFDSFVNTPVIVDHIALRGPTIFCSGLLGKERKIYKIDGGFVDLKNNFDSITRLNKLEVYDNELWMNGVAYLKGSKISKTTFQFNGLLWVDNSNNYPGAKSIAAGRGALFAVGNAEKPLSIWNKNTHVVKFYKGFALVTTKVFLDSNNNCVQDKNERILPKQLIKLNLPLVDRYAITNEQGMAEFLFNVPLNSTKIPFSIRLPRNLKPSICAYDSVFKTLINKYSDSLNFPITRKINVNDVKIIIATPKGTQVKKNNSTTYVVSCENVGSNTVSGFINLKKNSLLASSTYDPAPDQNKTTAAMVVWPYANLKPGEVRKFYYSGTAYDTSFSDNSPLQAQASASIAAASNDYPADDSDSIEQYIDNRDNPFRKDIYPIPNSGDSVSFLTMNDREIRYSITFNNYTSSIVYNATITDTLDLNLDMSYIQETGSNKSYYTELATDPNNPNRGIIIWHFNNINLAANPLKDFENMNSSSYIGFKVVMKPLNNGYLVKNTAAVFFDNQYAGKTNSVYCTIVSSDIPNVRKTNTFSVFPNPATTLLNINLSLNNRDQINVFNAQGMQVQSNNITESSEHFKLAIDGLNTGVYMVQIIKDGVLYYSKFIKQ